MFYSLPLIGWAIFIHDNRKFTECTFYYLTKGFISVRKNISKNDMIFLTDRMYWFYNDHVTKRQQKIPKKERENQMNIFLYVVGAIFLVVGVAVGIRNAGIASETGTKVLWKFPTFLGCIGLAIILTGNALVIIPTGYTGVKSTFGQIENVSIQNGANWKLPFVQKIEKVNNKQQDIYFEGQTWSETAERTALYYENVTVTYQINPEKSAWIYANVSSYKDNLVSDTLVASAIKAASKTLSSTDATNRGIIEPLSREKIQEALNEKYGENVVLINKVVIAGADFEDSYNDAIASKQNAQLAYEKQQIENRKNVEAAEAEAKVKTTNAKAAADAAVIKAKGEAEANELLEKSLTEMILREKYLDKWDGALPKVQTSDGADLMLDAGSFVSQSAAEEKEE